ncbi:MAG: DEAD/DEAH box helicase [Phycisphaerales bacterium]|jgi:hypothetical protein|nr:DEAD/DEAH box helicase [Phycisphaerales bacterium]
MVIAPPRTIVLHAVWHDARICLWGEDASRVNEGGAHPLAMPAADITSVLSEAGVLPRELVLREVAIEVNIPHAQGRPLPSPRLAHRAGLEAPPADALARVPISGLAIEPLHQASVLEAIEDRVGASLEISESLAFFGKSARFALSLLSQQRFVPMLMQEASGGLGASWRPWLADEANAARAAMLARSMPAACRAAGGERPGVILDEMLSLIVDAQCRRVLDRESMADTIEGRDAGDPHVAWLAGLLRSPERVPILHGAQTEVVKRVRQWIGALDDRGQQSQWRLVLRLSEPEDGGRVKELHAPPADLRWTLSFQLQSVDEPGITIDATEVWRLPADGGSVEGLRIESPHELLLGELGRASRLYPALEASLRDAEPTELLLATSDAYRFLREIRPVLIEQGFGAEAPEWWESPGNRLGARLAIDGGEPPLVDDAIDGGGGSGPSSTPQVGLGTLVNYHWEIAVGDTTLTLNEFESLVGEKAPLVRVGGRWVEIRPEDVKGAIAFIKENPGGQMAFGEAIRLAYASDPRQTGVPVLGLHATGWIAPLLEASGASERVPDVEQPAAFQGTLRAYQVRGFSWMAFLERFGLGACLADDMGLGKTIQLLALMLHERQHATEAEPVLPTLLVVPMSVVGNWLHECGRFAPNLRVYVHHGLERLQGDVLLERAESSDLVITTYALAHRDREHLERMKWGRVVLDEAQNIKNPSAKQTQAVHAFRARSRIALTGTPVENRLTELWSIMDFLNPGFLGGEGAFRRRFAVPIERYRDSFKLQQLRGLVQPFVLRRLKTDPRVVADLPEKLEGREFCHLTSEQAELYEQTVRRMLSEVEGAEGMRRRGVVLAALIRLKQICNHPAQLLKEFAGSGGVGPVPSPNRSGKTVRLIEMLGEVLAEGDQALVFTQFRQMGHLLQSMLQKEFDRDILFLHGGVSQGGRVQLIERFQKADGRNPVLILSLKAGGVGLNLTAANHVFHFDRWWNPAVENQATDRAHRIGQTRTVFVHKFVVRGTLEERIDKMIETKTELAENIIGSGERWITELSTDQLRDILTLRHDAVDDVA